MDVLKLSAIWVGMGKVFNVRENQVRGSAILVSRNSFLWANIYTANSLYWLESLTAACLHQHVGCAVVTCSDEQYVSFLESIVLCEIVERCSRDMLHPVGSNIARIVPKVRRSFIVVSRNNVWRLLTKFKD